MTIREAIRILNPNNTDGASKVFMKYMPDGFDCNKGIELTKEAQRMAVNALYKQLEDGAKTGDYVDVVVRVDNNTLKLLDMKDFPSDPKELVDAIKEAIYFAYARV